LKRYYEILGVGRDTPLDQVRQAYRDLVRVWHPDRFSSDYRLARISEEKLKLINEAYSEIRAQIGKNPPTEQGFLFTERRPASDSASPGDGEYMFDFYDPRYSPWIWIYQREHGSSPTASTVRNRPRRAVFLAAAICVLGVSFAAAAWHFGLLSAMAPAVPHPASRQAPAGSPGIPKIVEAVPRTGESPLGSGIRNGRSRIAMENDTEDDAVVKLVLLGTEGPRMVRSVFLAAGKAFTATEVPPGRYLVKVALGAGWDIREMRFRNPAGFASSPGVDLREEVADRPGPDGIVVRRLVSSELQVALNPLLGKRITEAEFLAD